ncbi:MAG: hypothetical protein KC635_24595 [Myxococcales bacterium]|nr:hypothetical protein [Myxococcales bacterium]
MSLRPALAFALALAAAPAATAMTLDPAPVPVLVREAVAVVHGHVIAATSDRDARGLVTRVVVDVWEAAQGPPELAVTDRVVVTLPGGREGRYRTVVPGVPELTPGDEVVLLLVVSADATWRPLGYALGVLFVGDDGALRTARGELVPGGWGALRDDLLAPTTPAAPTAPTVRP